MMAHWRDVALLLACAWLASCLAERPTRYNTTASRVNGKLNVHIVCHTHDDSGWLKTVDQYYYGSRQDIQLAGVQYILDTMVSALLANKDRKFVYAEMSFFTRWWAEQTPEMQAAVKQLVAEGRLDFVNGGWVQHDEAAAHYEAMIDQTTRGHRFLKETFNKVPRVGWQVDPFGHSATQASLMAGVLGFDALYFARADYQDMDIRRPAKRMELLWRGAQSYGASADVFTGNFICNNYGPPDGFNWDWGMADTPIMDDPDLEEYNVPDRIDEFVRVLQKYFDSTVGEDIALNMGNDFNYANAFVWFKNLDKLIHHANLDGRLNVFYSTPAIYTAAKAAYNASWPLKTDDFFPYADCPNCFWTGYFASRPASKGYIRAATALLHSARQMEALVGGAPQAAGAPSTDRLEAAAAVTQHHDSITGTEKQHVANDYHRLLAAGIAEAEQVISQAWGQLMGASAAAAELVPAQPSGPAQQKELFSAVQHKQAQPVASARHLLAGNSGAPTGANWQLELCGLLNVSVCEPCVQMSTAGQGFLVAAWNPLAWSRTEPVRLPLNASTAAAWTVTDARGKRVPAQLVPTSAATAGLQERLRAAALLPAAPATADHELVFLADLPPLGYETYAVNPSSQPHDEAAAPSTVRNYATAAEAANSDSVRIYNDNIGLVFDAATGKLAEVINAAGSVAANLSINPIFYTSHREGGQPSGAYIFRPDGVEDMAVSKLEVVQGPLVSEARQCFGDWVSLTLRLWHGAQHVEVEWTVGPIPWEDWRGKEVSFKYTSDLESGALFSTDANGREMQGRVRSARPTWQWQPTEPVAGNYYPLTAAIALAEPGRGEMAVLVDRGQGGASLASGELEVMVHRRILADDWRGVGENLNETLCGCTGPCGCDGLVVRGTHLLSLQPPAVAASARRALQQRLSDPPVIALAPLPPAGTQLRRSFSAASTQLPPSVHLLTLQALAPKRLLVRLAHLYQVGEDASLSNVTRVDLGALLAGHTITNMTELSLSTNQRRADMKRTAWAAGTPLSSDGAAAPVAFDVTNPVDALQCTSMAECGVVAAAVDLQPMQIRTFEIMVAAGSAMSH